MNGRKSLLSHRQKNWINFYVKRNNENHNFREHSFYLFEEMKKHEKTKPHIMASHIKVEIRSAEKVSQCR